MENRSITNDFFKFMSGNAANESETANTSADLETADAVSEEKQEDVLMDTPESEHTAEAIVEELASELEETSAEPTEDINDILEEPTDDVIEEAAVVGVDAEEPEAPAAQPSRRTTQRAAQPAPRPRRVRTIEETGEKSDEILEKESRKKTAKEKDEDAYRKLESLRRREAIAWGEIIGIEPKGVGESGFSIAVRYNGINVLIPEKEYFEATYEFGSDYEKLSEEQKANRRVAAARYQNGARVCFIVKGVVRNPIMDGEFAGETTTIAVGSRKEAMEKLRDMYFLHKENEPISSHEISVDDITTAHVIGVRENYIVVECLGVETRIDAYNLNNEYVENCSDFVSPGDTIKVRIRKLHINEDDVYLTVSGRLNDASKDILTMKQRGTYMGVVDHYNKSNNIYTVTLKNGVMASVKADNVQGGLELTNGDKVAVLVTRIYPTYVVGLAKKL